GSATTSPTTTLDKAGEVLKTPDDALLKKHGKSLGGALVTWLTGVAGRDPAALPAGFPEKARETVKDAAKRFPDAVTAADVAKVDAAFDKAAEVLVQAQQHKTVLDRLRELSAKATGEAVKEA